MLVTTSWLARLQGTKPDPAKFLTQPLVSHIYTADPSAHVFKGRIYIYPSHDFEAGVKQDDLGSHFAMRDYHVLSMDAIGGKVTDHGVALDIEDVPWAGRQMWAPDAAEKDGQVLPLLPRQGQAGRLPHRRGRLGAIRPAPSRRSRRPSRARYSMDPAVFKDRDGKYYMYFGGIWGGQLQRWATGQYKAADVYPAADQPALTPKVALMRVDMKGFAEKVRDVVILDEGGKPLTAGDNKRRFFEASWVHYYGGKYYFSYSTGDTHFIVYATGDSPYGPFTYRGRILEPVLGWTNHHSIIEVAGKWYLFYHDAQLSGGQTHLRNVKVVELKHRADGTIETIDAYLD